MQGKRPAGGTSAGKRSVRKSCVRTQKLAPAPDLSVTFTGPSWSGGQLFFIAECPPPAVQRRSRSVQHIVPRYALLTASAKNLLAPRSSCAVKQPVRSSSGRPPSAEAEKDHEPYIDLLPQIRRPAEPFCCCQHCLTAPCEVDQKESRIHLRPRLSCHPQTSHAAPSPRKNVPWCWAR